VVPLPVKNEKNTLIISKAKQLKPEPLKTELIRTGRACTEKKNYIFTDHEKVASTSA